MCLQSHHSRHIGDFMCQACPKKEVNFSLGLCIYEMLLLWLGSRGWLCHRVQLGCSGSTTPRKSVAVAVYTCIQAQTIEKWNMGV